MKTKICTKCGIEKELSDFHKQKDGKFGVRTICKECNQKYRDNHKNDKAQYQKEFHKKYPWKRTLKSIKQRCNNPKFIQYKDYGGGGIKCLITVEELKRLWFRDKAYLMDKPSIDREDNDGDYELDNCRYIEKGLNSQKDKFKPILQFGLNDIFIKEFKSITDASNILKISKGNICMVLKGKRKTTSKFKWKYKEEKK